MAQKTLKDWGRKWGYVVVVLFAVINLSSPAFAQLEIDITKGNAKATPVAIPDFLSAHPQTNQIARDMAKVISDDLERSGLFDVLDQALYIEKQTDINYQPRFSDWRLINARVLVSGRVVRESADRLKVEFRLWDIYGGKQLDGLRFATTPDNWRRIAHKISDAIYKRITGEGGYFDTRIVYIAENGPKVNRRKRLAIMDQDGANSQYLLAGADLVLTPRFSPSAQKITYLSWETGVSQVYLLDIETGRRELLGNFPNMTLAPRFSPDGKKLIFSMVKKGNSDVYVMDLTSKSTQRLTTNSGIDISPSFSPDGKRIVFTSDRGGSPQLYIMAANGANVKRISFGKGRYTAPNWSPRGDLIAFTKSTKGRFHIGVLNAKDGKGERLLTDSYLDEGPTWSPNGRVILFTRETRGAQGRSAVWSVDLTGANLRKVATPGSASDPAWSPILP
ncbi:MAG: Tol-Pal system beta propeller repeat protein TolB [Robiginitomaculum sp.]|nr:MAG: Tol-Pal system beta propeller repeat protein TolB [Robiginitomaculum sp.]